MKIHKSISIFLFSIVVISHGQSLQKTSAENIESGFYLTVNYKPSNTEKNIQLEKTPAISAHDISRTNIDTSSDGRPVINIEFDLCTAQQLSSITKKNIGKPLVIVIDNQIISMPIIHEKITNGKIQISGNFTLEEIERLVEILNQ